MALGAQGTGACGREELQQPLGRAADAGADAGGPRLRGHRDRHERARRDRAAGAAGAAGRGDDHHGRGGAPRGLRRPRRHRPREGGDLRGAGARRRRRSSTATSPTYPILLAAARRAGARPVRFGRSGRPEFRLGEVQVHARRHLRRGAGARAAVPLPARRAGAAPGDERARRPRRGRGAGRRRRPRGAGARAMAGAGGARRALDGAARPGRARRRDHADRRELQRQSRRRWRRPSRSSPASGRPTGIGRVRAGGGWPSSATCWSSGRASASCMPGWPRCRR